MHPHRNSLPREGKASSYRHRESCWLLRRHRTTDTTAAALARSHCLDTVPEEMTGQKKKEAQSTSSPLASRLVTVDERAMVSFICILLLIKKKQQANPYSVS